MSQEVPLPQKIESSKTEPTHAIQVPSLDLSEMLSKPIIGGDATTLSEEIEAPYPVDEALKKEKEKLD